jgi:hypothetical protein
MLLPAKVYRQFNIIVIMASSVFPPRMLHQIKTATLFGCGWDVESTLLDYEESKRVPE